MFHQKVIEKIINGIVIIRNFLSIEEQKKVVEIVEKFGKLINDEGNPNFSKTRGRNYSNLDEYDREDREFMKDICERTMTDVREIDNTIPNSNVTHLLTLYYLTKIGMGYHKDDGENDGDSDAPVISFTIGNSCIFDCKIDNEVFPNVLNSGDVIVFGGPQRMVLHRVKKIINGTVPNYLNLDNARINLTFRQATSVIGHEDNFSTDKYVEKLKEEWENKKNKIIII